MGKTNSRSSKLVAQPKKAPKLDKVFTCPFCNHPESVKCLIYLKLGYAEASCLICEESYCTVPHNLTAPTDIYHEWIDECEHANDDAVCAFAVEMATDEQRHIEKLETLLAREPLPSGGEGVDELSLVK